jgi:hypothetical protein
LQETWDPVITGSHVIVELNQSRVGECTNLQFQYLGKYWIQSSAARPAAEAAVIQQIVSATMLEEASPLDTQN